MGPAFGGFDRLRVLGEAKGKTCNRAMSVVSSSQRTTGLMGGGRFAHPRTFSGLHVLSVV